MIKKAFLIKNWHSILPIIAIGLTISTWSKYFSVSIMLMLSLLLVLSVFSAVHHAELIALKVGEPFGSLILAVSVTVIEVGMIVVLFLNSPIKNQNLARDTVFSAVMITTTGIVGTAFLVKSIRQREATFNAFGAGSALAALAALCTLTLILPSFTVSSPGPTFTNTQLAFAAIISLTIYFTFIAVQTIRHRDYFLPPVNKNKEIDIESHVSPPSAQQAYISLALLLVSLVSVVGLAKTTSPLIQDFVDDRNLPQTVVAITIALIVLMPESISAFKAAKYGRTQTSLNLAYGSALASIGLTIPAISIISIVNSYSINLGLNPAEIVLASLAFFVSTLTVVTGKASLLQSVVHLSIFGSFLVFAVSP
jgi:Ca2+:H+ antiporter